MSSKQLPFKKSKKRFKPPSIIVILLIVTVVVWIISLIPYPTLNHGSYFTKDPNSPTGMKEVIIDQDNPLNVTRLGILDILIAPFFGFVGRADFITFLFTLGVFIYLVMKTKCIEAGVGGLIKKMKGKEHYLIPILMFMISFLGTIYGFAEETLALYPILIPIILGAGFDTITTMFILFLGSTAGVAGSIINPFSIGVASNTVNNVLGAGVVSMTTGIVPRIVVWLLLTIIFSAFTTIYALRVKKNPKHSYVANNLESQRKKYASQINFDQLPKLNASRIGALIVFGLTFLLMVVFTLPFHNWGFKGFDWLSQNIRGLGITELISGIGHWYFVEYSFLFLISSLILGLGFLRQKEEEFIGSVYYGWKDMVGLVIMISIASGISEMLAHSNLDKYVSVAIKNAGLAQFDKTAFVLIMLFIYMLLGLIITSTSSLAILTFPFVGPLAYELGGTNMIGIMFMVFMLGSNFTSLFTPTNVLFMAPLSQYDIPLNKWYKSQIFPIVTMLVVSISLALFFTHVPIVT